MRPSAQGHQGDLAEGTAGEGQGEPPGPAPGRCYPQTGRGLPAPLRAGPGRAAQGRGEAEPCGRPTRVSLFTPPHPQAGERPLLTTPPSTGPAAPGSSWSRSAPARGSAARRVCPRATRRRPRRRKGRARPPKAGPRRRLPPCCPRPAQEVRAAAAPAQLPPRGRSCRGSAKGARRGRWPCGVGCCGSARCSSFRSGTKAAASRAPALPARMLRCTQAGL